MLFRHNLPLTEATGVDIIHHLPWPQGVDILYTPLTTHRGHRGRHSLYTTHHSPRPQGRHAPLTKATGIYDEAIAAGGGGENVHDVDAAA